MQLKCLMEQKSIQEEQQKNKNIGTGDGQKQKLSGELKKLLL